MLPVIVMTTAIVSEDNRRDQGLSLKTLIGIVAVLALALSAFGQQLTDDQVRLAIARGNRKPHQIGLTLNDKQTAFFSRIVCQTCGQSGYTITVYNPEQWVELCAAQAKKEMQPFSVADVTDEMRAQELHVVALPSQAEYLTGNGIAGSSSVHRVVLNDTARQTTIQPLEVRQNTLQGNSAFRSVEYTMASAEFSLSDVARLRDSDPKGEFFIVVVGDNQNKFFKVKSRDFKTLFPKGGDGRTAASDRTTPVLAAAAPSAAQVPAGATNVEIVPAPQPLSTTTVAGATATAIPTVNGGGPLGGVATKANNPARTTGEASSAHATAEIRQDPNPFPGSDPPPSVPGTAVSSAGQPEAVIGVWFTGHPTVRHDGVEISGVQANGPADDIDIKPGDVILAIDGHYLYTIDELRAELLRHEPGARMAIRYRHYRLTSENYLTLTSKDAVPHR
jgi:PDZ domain